MRPFQRLEFPSPHTSRLGNEHESQQRLFPMLRYRRDKSFTLIIAEQTVPLIVLSQCANVAGVG